VLAEFSATMNRVSRIRRVILWLTSSVLIVPVLARADDAIQSLDAVRSAAQSFVLQQLPKQAPGQAQVTVGLLDARLRLPPCAEALKVSLPAGATFRARMTVAVSCATGSTWTVYVPVTVDTQTSVLVLRRAAGRGERLSAEDVELQTRVISGTGDSYLTDAAELSGRTVKRPLGAGTALTTDLMAADLVVRRGQHVTLLASVGGLEVRAAGLAMNDAPAAGRVKVQNLSSSRIVEGVVESPDVIRITP
jgi:flagella basal body P-ring formation protein FlgA